MTRNKKTVEKLLLDGFGGSRTARYFQDFTDEEYIGYIVGVTENQHLTFSASTLEFMHTARKLFKEGKL